jgi:hypothetical protein
VLARTAVAFSSATFCATASRTAGPSCVASACGGWPPADGQRRIEISDTQADTECRLVTRARAWTQVVQMVVSSEHAACSGASVSVSEGQVMPAAPRGASVASAAASAAMRQRRAMLLWCGSCCG